MTVATNPDGLWNKLVSQTTQPNRPQTTSYVRQQTPASIHQSYTKHTTQPSYTKSACDTCVTSTNKHENEKTDVFIVENAFARANTRTVTASGKITKGGFSVGDKVLVKTTLEERIVPIQQMFRQGESINYANVSSGKIAIVIANAADIMVRNGDTITKKK